MRSSSSCSPSLDQPFLMNPSHRARARAKAREGLKGNLIIAVFKPMLAVLYPAHRRRARAPRLCITQAVILAHGKPSENLLSGSNGFVFWQALGGGSYPNRHGSILIYCFCCLRSFAPQSPNNISSLRPQGVSLSKFRSIFLKF